MKNFIVGFCLFFAFTSGYKRKLNYNMPLLLFPKSCHFKLLFLMELLLIKNVYTYSMNLYFSTVNEINDGSDTCQRGERYFIS